VEEKMMQNSKEQQYNGQNLKKTEREREREREDAHPRNLQNITTGGTRARGLPFPKTKLSEQRNIRIISQTKKKLPFLNPHFKIKGRTMPNEGVKK
jgi:hypothetical protein